MPGAPQDDPHTKHGLEGILMIQTHKEPFLIAARKLHFHPEFHPVLVSEMPLDGVSVSQDCCVNWMT